MKVDWKTSEARKIVLNDLGSGFLALNPKDISAREAWGTLYEYMDEFEGIEFNQFSRNLSSYRKKMASDSKFVWNNTCAQDIVLKDLETGRLPAYQREMSSEEAWRSLYSTRKEFKNVPFWHFEERLRELRSKKQMQLRSDFEHICLLKDMSRIARKIGKEGMKPNPGTILADILTEYPGLAEWDGDAKHLYQCQ
ncbi:unnamed protein product [Cylindrotheca closterium]|uniref:Uncharacterized protein n=1 Tax=Cylindrotheca closterium TaxID=2856 RepID=A0AAD2FRV5_9STRA|nr:unnamed protein product [Cylindrotheca closterium]